MLVIEQRWEEVTEMDKQKTVAVSAAHLVVCRLLYRILFMLKGILKSVGSLVDKPRTCNEYKLFHPEQNLQHWLIYIDLSHWRLCIFEYRYATSTHLKSVN